MKREGKKTPGKVTEIKMERVISPNGDETKYRFVVGYHSSIEDADKTIVTPYLGFVPKGGVQYVCDVYEMMPADEEPTKEYGSVLADDFRCL